MSELPTTLEWQQNQAAPAHTVRYIQSDRLSTKQKALYSSHVYTGDSSALNLNQEEETSLAE